ncbi:MAG TPA: hypothetical protein VIV11_35820 [Kofleriaceae bacterium]
MTATSQPIGSSLFRYFVFSIALALVGNLGARMLLEANIGPSWIAIAIAVAAIVPLTLTAYRFRRLLSELDELLQKVVLEGFATALVVFLPLAALYVNLRSAGVYVPRLDPPDILMTPALLVLASLLLAWRRYR